MIHQSLPKVSVILPVYNGAKTVAAAARSILSQSYPNLELLIINDGSTDTTKEVVDALGDSRIRVIHLEKNVGRSEARNLGISYARGTYVAMIDADDISYPDRLEEQVAFMEDRSDVALCGAWANLREPSGRLIEWRTPTEEAAIRQNLLRANPFIHCTILIRRSVLETVGGFDPDMEPAEDYDLYLRVARHYRVANIPFFMAEYRAHTGIHYRLQEQWAKIPVRWRAVFTYGYPKWELVHLATPVLTLWIPVSMKLYLRRWLAHYKSE